MIQTNECQWFLLEADDDGRHDLAPSGPCHASVPEAEAWLLANLSLERPGAHLVLFKCFRHVCVVERVTLEVEEVSHG